MIEHLKILSEFYKTNLLEDNIPFWLKNSIDKENGGFLFSLDRKGNDLSGFFQRSTRK